MVKFGKSTLPGKRTSESRHFREREQRDADFAIAEDRHIPYDPEDGPYDPNNDAAVEAYWKDALIVHGDGTILQQPTQSDAPAKSPQTVL